MDSEGVLLYLMAPSPRSKRLCMRLAPVATALLATVLPRSRNQNIQRRRLYSLIALAR